MVCYYCCDVQGSQGMHAPGLAGLLKALLHHVFVRWSCAVHIVHANRFMQGSQTICQAVVLPLPTPCSNACMKFLACRLLPQLTRVLRHTL